MDSGPYPGKVRASLLPLIILVALVVPSQSADVDPLVPVAGETPLTTPGGHAPSLNGATLDPLALPFGDDTRSRLMVGDASSPMNLDALPADVRAIWVVRDALRDPEPERIVAYAKELGANTLFVQVSGRGDAWYDSDILPRAEQLAPTRGDPFARLMAAAEEAGLSVHAWINVGLVWSGRKPPKDPTHIVNSHPEWIACLPDGAPLSAVPRDSLLAWYVEGIFAEPAHAGYRAHIASVAKEILDRYPISGVHLDYIRRPVIDTGYDVETVGRFLDRSGHVAWEIVDASMVDDVAKYVVRTSDADDPRHRPSGRPWYVPRKGASHAARAFRWPDYSDVVKSPAKKEWNRYRREAVTLAVARIRTVLDEAVAADGRERILTAAVIPDPERAHLRFAQDWPLWVESGLLDYVVPMCYASGRERAGAQLELALAAVPAERVIAGAGAYQQPIGACALTLRDMLDKDVRGVCIFSWASLHEQREKRAPGLVRRAWMPNAEMVPRAGVTSPEQVLASEGDLASNP